MSNFIMQAAMFAATLAAVQKGTTVQKHAAIVVSVGGAPDVATFVAAFENKSENEAESMSLSNVLTYCDKVKPSKSRPLLNAAGAVAEHNKAHPSAPVLLSVDSFGIYSILSAPKPRKSRAKGTVGAGSRKSSFAIALACCKADGYTIRADGTSKASGGEGITYWVNDVRCDGHLSKVLYRDCDNNSQTVAELTKYHYKR